VVNIKIFQNVDKPSRMLSTALRIAFSKCLASVELWKVSPNLLPSVRQWWNVGFARVYWRSLCSAQLSTTCRRRIPGINQEPRTSWINSWV